MDSPWRVAVRLEAVPEKGLVRDLEADEAMRRKIADALDLVELKQLTGRVELTPWHDGARIAARWRAVVVQACSVSLEPLESELAGAFEVRVVPQDSAMAPSEDLSGDIDLEADDPPDVSEDWTVDLGAYLVEHLALEIDPFPRKPDAVFEPPATEENVSPFAALSRLKREE